MWDELRNQAAWEDYRNQLAEEYLRNQIRVGLPGRTITPGGGLRPPPPIPATTYPPMMPPTTYPMPGTYPPPGPWGQPWGAPSSGFGIADLLEIAAPLLPLLFSLPETPAEQGKKTTAESVVEHAQAVAKQERKAFIAVNAAKLGAKLIRRGRF